MVFQVLPGPFTKSQVRMKQRGKLPSPMCELFVYCSCHSIVPFCYLTCMHAACSLIQEKGGREGGVNLQFLGSRALRHQGTLLECDTSTCFNGSEIRTSVMRHVIVLKTLAPSIILGLKLHQHWWTQNEKQLGQEWEMQAITYKKKSVYREAL